MKTTTLTVLLGVSLFLGGCGAHGLRPALAGGPEGRFATLDSGRRDDRATLDWNAAVKPLATPTRFQK